MNSTKVSKYAAAALAVLAFTAPLSSVAFAEPSHHSDRGNQRDNDRRENGRRDSDRRDNDRRDNDQRTRWDAQRYNGYTVNGQWRYGPPPSSILGRADFRPGYRAWRRGDRLPSVYRSQYRAVDYRREHLRAPPRGYHYVRDNRGEVLLVGVATGVILSIIASH